MPFHLTGSLQRSVDWDAQCAVSVSFSRRAKHRTCGAHSSAARAWHQCNPSPHLLLPDSTFNVNRLSLSTLPPLIHRSHEPTLLYLQASSFWWWPVGSHEVPPSRPSPFPSLCATWNIQQADGRPWSARNPLGGAEACLLRTRESELRRGRDYLGFVFYHCSWPPEGSRARFIRRR